ncbi:MAG: hypothetical protein HYT93_00035 [Parcubacteria group bacterium]|nr:hypothetical protein [Parcubacteria group bacterium]
MEHRKNIVFLAIFFFFIAYILIGIVYTSSDVWKPDMAFAEEKEYWKRQIETTGAKNAYEKLGNVLKESSALTQHIKSHIFGEVLYEQEGIDGLAICDRRFQNGCFHEVVERVIKEHGVDILKNLDTVCKNTIRHEQGCEHGAGHGILAYTGYTEEDLRSALKLCDNFSLKSPIGGCYQGVFMEYGRQDALIGQKSISPSYSPFEGDSLYPCNKVDERYQDSCVFFQPEYWKGLFFKNNISSDTIKQIGEWCITKATSHAIPCFQGIGDVAMESANFNTSTAMSLCDGSSENPDHQLACRIQAFIIKGVLEGVTPRDAIDTCRNLAPPIKEKCSYRVSEVTVSLRKNPD